MRPPFSDSHAGLNSMISHPPTVMQLRSLKNNHSRHTKCFPITEYTVNSRIIKPIFQTTLQTPCNPQKENISDIVISITIPKISVVKRDHHTTRSSSINFHLNQPLISCIYMDSRNRTQSHLHNNIHILINIANRGLYIIVVRSFLKKITYALDMRLVVHPRQADPNSVAQILSNQQNQRTESSNPQQVLRPKGSCKL